MKTKNVLIALLVGLVVLVILFAFSTEQKTESYKCSKWVSGGFGRANDRGFCYYYPNTQFQINKNPDLPVTSQYKNSNPFDSCNGLVECPGIANKHLLSYATNDCNNANLIPEVRNQACLQKVRYESLNKYRPNDIGPYRNIDLNVDATTCNDTNCPFPYMCMMGNCILLPESIQDMLGASGQYLN